MLTKSTKALTCVAALAVAVTACSSSKPSNSAVNSNTTTTAAGNTSTTSGSTAPKETISVGVISDVTGLASSGNKTAVKGVEAAQALAARDGVTLKIYQADTQSSPTSVLSAAQTLVEQDHVQVVISVSALLFTGGAAYLTAQGVPVIGAAEDGPEWLTAANMFGTFLTDQTKVTTTFGKAAQLLGVTNLGSLGYSVSPLSAEAAKSSGVSAEQVGLKAGYVNSSFQFGSTNVQPIALAMKAAGIDGVTASVDPNTGFALITALRQLGVKLKAAMLPTGYGGDLLQAGPGALQAAQDVYFYGTLAPMELNTPATQQFAADLKTVGITQDPTYAEYQGYAAVAMLLQGLKTAGPNPTRASLITALRGITDYDAAGLLSKTYDISQREQNLCIYVTKLSGTTFELVPGADPICGTLTTKTVSAAT